MQHTVTIVSTLPSYPYMTIMFLGQPMVVPLDRAAVAKRRQCQADAIAGQQRNLTDPDSALMHRPDAHEYRQSYNAQAMVRADGAQLILATVRGGGKVGDVAAA